ncbi:MAG: DNA-directed RNA polymerase subunit beta' [Clostridia bacterium]|nr:DNA-directed RNA polymerase subunit beta' [Clostridia bacterium]
MGNNTMERNIFDSIKIGLASPEMMRSWSKGEVKKPETINYRTLKPEKDGLFCEKIFGPTKDYECACGKHKRTRYTVPVVCERCEVLVTTKKVRRERMGHIELAAPVAHIWYSRANPSRIGTLLDISPKVLEKVLYFIQYIVIDPGVSTPLTQNQALTDREYAEYQKSYGGDFEVGMGAEAIKKLLQKLDLDQLSKQLKEELLTATGQKKAKIIKRLAVVESFRKSGNKPEWMILEAIPVLPPDIRPMVQLDGGRYASSDLNDLYRRVINRNNRLAKLAQLNAPEIIIRNEKRMLQEAVDALIDNGHHGKGVTGPSNRPLKSLSDMLRGKQGRFRQNLLGKRVDYSGRSVIVVGPELRIYQCGLPKEMALELFKPFVMKRLEEAGKSTNIKDARKKVERGLPEVWDALEIVIKEHPVLLNRAPTLHRLSVQAFEPVLVEGRAIKLHPLVCTAFNADFDGDQMPVHVPLSSEAQAEARFLMLSANNLLKPADGCAVAVPSQDMVLGSYYMTIDKPGEKGEGKWFRNLDEAVMAYENGTLGLHAMIHVRVEKTVNDEIRQGVIHSTLGRMLFNQPIPQDLGFVDRTVPGNEFLLEIDEPVTKKVLSKLVDRCIKKHPTSKTANVLDAIKSQGFKYSTKSGISISIADVTIPNEKYTLIQEAEERVGQIRDFYNEGLLTENQRYSHVIDVWSKTTDSVVSALKNRFDRYNPIKMMSDSGARGNMTQMRQLAGMRGLMFKASGETMELPIKSNFREGLKILEYFIAARGARKSLSDTALRTADSGYLTRRLVDVSQEIIIRREDCGTRKGTWVSDILDENNQPIEKLEERLMGRYTCGEVVHPETGEILVSDNVMLGDAEIKKITKAGIDKVYIRTLLECRALHGVCAHCYGSDLASGKPVNIGEAVGIIAAQSIGEPGTQLTMRTFHTGGVAGSNITNGLPRVEELFEARRPKKSAILSEIDGTVVFGQTTRTKSVDIVPEDNPADKKTYSIPYNSRITVPEGASILKGTPITEGSLYPGDILRISGIDAVYEYIIQEVQKVYRGQSVDINDRHIEVIARQMTKKLKIVDSGSSDLLNGAMVDRSEFRLICEALKERIAAGETDLVLPTADVVLLGITKASLQTESFLSAASFQETTKVLTDAAIVAKTDKLLGLKENVIIGKLIPAGTGMEYYRNVEIKKRDAANDATDGYDEV